MNHILGVAVYTRKHYFNSIIQEIREVITKWIHAWNIALWSGREGDAAIRKYQLKTSDARSCLNVQVLNIEYGWRGRDDVDITSKITKVRKRALQ